MQQVIIPARFLVHCMYCKEPINSNDKGVFRRGTAWFKRQGAKNPNGLNAATMVEWTSEWACTFCMKKLLANIPVEQMQLFPTND